MLYVPKPLHLSMVFINMDCSVISFIKVKDGMDGIDVVMFKNDVDREQKLVRDFVSSQLVLV